MESITYAWKDPRRDDFSWKSTWPFYYIYFKSKVEGDSRTSPWQTYISRQDLLARVFRLKIIKLMNLIKNHKNLVHYDAACVYKWVAKERLALCPYIIVANQKINSNQIDFIILPYIQTYPTLFEIIKSHVEHRPYDNINRKSHCIVDDQYKKNDNLKCFTSNSVQWGWLSLL